MTETRSGLVALVGEPNAGKSTLMNHIVGNKVSIVTHKAQTTRTRVRGIALAGSTQIVFVDTPGLFAPRNKLDRAMVAAAWKGLTEADAVLLLIQAHRGLTSASKTIIEKLKRNCRENQKTALAINKIDLVRRDSLLATVASACELTDFDKVFMISASKGSGVSDVVAWLADSLPAGPWPYPADQIADSSLQAMAAEITREKLMLRMHQEIPYKLSVETESWTPLADGTVRIEQIVYAATKSHKKMLIGPGGSVIRQIGSDARKDISELAECKVHLFLQVKLRPKWIDESERYERMGLTYADANPKGTTWRK